jgi:penicillin-insensitive murein endopeptidase
VPGGDGCSAKELDYWFSDKVIRPQIAKPTTPPKPIMLADLPPACKTVLDAPDKKARAATDNR